MQEYKTRLIDNEIDNSLKAYGAINIVGAKWIGKTWTARNHSSSELLLMDSKGNYQNRRLAETDVSLIFDGSVPRLIDEWQEVPEIWDATRYKCDEDGKKEKYILTGSTVLSDKKKSKIKHSGAGRIKKIKMYPMSLYESGDSSGDVSLKDLYNNKVKNKLTGEISLKHIIKEIIDNDEDRISDVKTVTEY